MGVEDLQSVDDISGHEVIELKDQFNRLMRQAMGGRWEGPKRGRMKFFRETKKSVLRQIGLFDEFGNVVEGKEDLFEALKAIRPI